MSRALLVSAGVVVANLLLYTAYSKRSKKLEAGQLTKVLTGSEGLDHTLVELNKVAGLAGLTDLCLAFLPPLKGPERRDLLFIAMATLWGHSCYSIYRFYGDTNVPAVSKYPSLLKDLLRAPNSQVRLQGLRKVSVLAGIGGQAVLLAGWLGKLQAAAVGLGAVLLGVLHFYTMEVDYALRLQVRPFGLLPFPLALLALGAVLTAR